MHLLDKIWYVSYVNILVDCPVIRWNIVYFMDINNVNIAYIRWNMVCVICEYIGTPSSY